MFPTRKPILLLHLSGNVIRTTADHPFYVHGQGWTDAAELQVDDHLRTHDGQDVPIEAITDTGKGDVVYQMDAAVPPFPWSNTLLDAGSIRDQAFIDALATWRQSEAPAQEKLRLRLGD